VMVLFEIRNGVEEYSACKNSDFITMWPAEPISNTQLNETPALHWTSWR